MSRRLLWGIISLWAVALPSRAQEHGAGASAAPLVRVPPSEEEMKGLVSHKDGAIIGLSEKRGCSAMLEAFCRDIYSPQNKGNVDIVLGGDRKTSLRAGETSNGFSQSYMNYEKALIAAKERLPKDFKAYLDKSGYFEKLEKYLARPDMRTLTKKENLAINPLINELSEIWNSSYQSVVIDRMEKDVPGFNAMNPVPIPIQYKAEDMDDQLAKEIDEDIWKENPAWKRTEDVFQQVRTHFVSYLSELKNVPDSTRREWIEKIKTVKFVVPTEDASQGCSTTMVNAFYMPKDHAFTVCGGVLGTYPDMPGLIAHELAHALDPGTEMYRAIRDSSLSDKVFSLQREVCEKAPLTVCPDSWKELSSPNRLKKMTDSLGDWKPFSPDFYSCLQYKSIKGSPSAAVIKRKVVEGVQASNAWMADNNWMVRLIKPELIHWDSRVEINPNYKNPCGLSKPKRNEFSLEGVQNLFYVAAFICDGSSDTDDVKLTRAAQTAAAMQSIIAEKTTPYGGKFSSNGMMVSAGFSEYVGERFADAIGNAVYGRMLKKSGVSPEERRLMFASASAFYCDAPSLALKYPRETQAQKKFSYEPHSEAQQRRWELMGPAIREALICEKDFDIKDCIL